MDATKEQRQVVFREIYPEPVGGVLNAALNDDEEILRYYWASGRKQLLNSGYQDMAFRKKGTIIQFLL